MAVILLITFSMATQIATAHEQKTALTDIYYNERTGSLEVAHRFSLHDAEHTLQKVTDSQANLYASEDARAAFAAYVVENFELRFLDDTVVPLVLVGQELDEGFLWVYQECRIPVPVTRSYSIRNSILMDAVEGQVNTVNVRYRSRVSTMVFGAGNNRQLYEGPARGEELP